MLKEELARPFEPGRVDTLPADAWTVIDVVPPPFRDVDTQLETQERERFVDDKIGGDEELPSLENRIPRSAHLRVIRVLAVGYCDPAGRIHKYRFHRP